jgi:hypothetical protein
VFSLIVPTLESMYVECVLLLECVLSDSPYSRVYVCTGIGTVRVYRYIGIVCMYGYVLSVYIGI